MSSQDRTLRPQNAMVKGGVILSSDDPQTNSVPIPMKYDIPPSIITRLATQFTIQTDKVGWHLSFYEAIPPLVFGTPDEVRTQLEKVESVKAECVARVFIPAARVSEFLAVIRNVSQSAEAPAPEDATV
jgi:hypothetical protein